MYRACTSWGRTYPPVLASDSFRHATADTNDTGFAEVLIDDRIIRLIGRSSPALLGHWY